MNDETLNSLNKIRQLILQQEQLKRFMTVQNACINYKMDQRTIMKVAKKRGALYKVRTITLIDMNAFEPYLENKFQEAD